jgi:hypothetical protein
MATYFVPAGIPLQHHVNGEPAASYVLHAFLAGTSTSTNMFTNSSGTSAGTSITLDSEGYTQTSGTRHPVWLDDSKSYKLELREDDDTTVVWQVDNISSKLGVIHHSTVAAAKADTGLALNDLVRTTEHTSGYGYQGGNLYIVVAGGTGTDDNGSYLDTDNSLQLKALFPNGVNDKHFGAAHDNSTNDTVAVMAAYDYTSTNGVPLEICEGDIVISDQGGTSLALDWDGGFNGLRITMKGTFQYGAGTGVALRIGQGTAITHSVFDGLRVSATIQTPYEDMAGIGILLVEVGESVFRDCRVDGFREGYSLRPTGTPSAVVGNTFENCSSADCYYNVYVEPGDFDGCFVTANRWRGGSHTTPPAGFSNIVTANAHLISIHNPSFAIRSGNTVDGNTFDGVKIEQSVTRKIYCEGNSNHFANIYFDSGTYHSGNTHASGNYPYRESGITGFTSDGSSTITKVAHGLQDYIIIGDAIFVSTNSANISDSGSCTVVAITANTIQLNRAITVPGTLVIAHYSANIEFAGNGHTNHFTDCETIGLQVITDRLTASKKTTSISGGRMGLVKGAMPPLGTKGDDSFPGGFTDTPQPGLFNLWESTIGGVGTLNAYLGNTNDDDTDANVQLCFGALDASDRQGVYASVMANKEGRGVAQPYGGLVFRTRASGSNSFLVDRLGIDSNGVVTINDDHFIVENSKTPSNASDAGTAGTICWDSNYIYICVATDTWKRVGISTW